jgi:hypothetical protein
MSGEKNMMRLCRVVESKGEVVVVGFGGLVACGRIAQSLTDARLPPLLHHHLTQTRFLATDPNDKVGSSLCHSNITVAFTFVQCTAQRDSRNGDCTIWIHGRVSMISASSLEVPRS